MAAHLVLAKFDGLTNSYMTPEQRAAVDPNSMEYYNRVWGSKIQVIGWSFYAMILWLVKFSVAIFYSRLTYVHAARLGMREMLNGKPGLVCFTCPCESASPMSFWA